MVSKRPQVNRWLRYSGGAAVCVVSILGIWYALRVSYAQIHYQRIKYREPEKSLSEVNETALELQDIYAHNYHLSDWMANRALYQDRNTEIAAHWARIGTTQNPHRLALRWVEAAVVGMDNPEEAARLWESYSDNVFWNRWVMAGRVYWLSHAGRTQEAEHYMNILRGIHGDHGWAEEALETALRNQQ